MDLILVKIFATALAGDNSAQAVKTHFDAVADQDKVVERQARLCNGGRAALRLRFIVLAGSTSQPKIVW